MQGPPPPPPMQGPPMQRPPMQGPPMQRPPMQGPPMQRPPMQGPPPSGGMGAMGYAAIAILVLIIVGLIIYQMSRPVCEVCSDEGCPSCPTPDCRNAADCPPQQPCPQPDCPDCPSCPDCAPTRSIKWTRYPNTNGVWGLGGMPANDTTLNVDLPAGVKLYGRFGDNTKCEQACKDDQPFCRSWAQSPNAPGSPWSNTCYGLNNTHFRAHYEPGMTSGMRSYVL